MSAEGYDRSAGQERRREIRMALLLPVRVQGQYPDGEPWQEMTSTSDASFGGASMGLRRVVLRGQALHLSLPLPKRFRTHDFSAPSYRVYAVVCAVKPNGEVGIRFLGKEPPGGYARNGAGLFLTPPTAAAAGSSERRAAPRRDGVFFFVLKPSSDRTRREEATVADNIGAGGARVKTTQPFAAGEIIEVEEPGGSFRTRAAVRHAYVGADAVGRLNLMFLDGQAPERLLFE
jgi:PilZ domain-containing protein